MSSSGNPRIVEITACGSGAANSVTNSTLPLSIQLSISRLACSVIISRCWSAPEAPTHGSVSCSRCSLCVSMSGRSRSRAVTTSPKPSSSKISSWILLVPEAPGPTRDGNRSGSRTTLRMSSYLVSTYASEPGS